MKIMAVDLGDSRTGIAVSDVMEMLASPLKVIHEKGFKKCAEQVSDAAKDENVGLIVVGYPKNINNTVGEKAEKCKAFGDYLHELTALPVVMWDERYTTVSAHRYLNETNVRGQKRKNIVDAVAAVIILESYLGYRKNTKGEN